MLDVLVQLVTCAREVGVAYAEVEELELQRRRSLDDTAALMAHLDRFREESAFGMRATAREARRPEIRKHAEEAIASLGKMIEGWQRSYRHAQEREARRIDQRIADLEVAMRASLERLALPLRGNLRARRMHRVHQETTYTTTLEGEWVPGLRIRLTGGDAGSETPLRMRTLLGGKNVKIRVGTKKALLRRTEGPNFVRLDEWFVLELRVGPGMVRLLLARKPSGNTEALDLEIASEGAAVAARVRRADGSTQTLPAEDHPTLREIWDALQGELDRAFADARGLAGLALDGDPVEGADALLRTMEALVAWYRPIVAEIAAHSPSLEELSIKVEREDGRREEAYVHRADLGQHLVALPGDLRRRLGIPALLPTGDLTEHASAPGLAPILEPDAGDKSGRIDLPIWPPPPSRALGGAPVQEVTEDISLCELVLGDSDILELDLEPDRCADRPIVLRSTGR